MFEPLVKNLTIADGQLPSTAGVIVSGPGNHARHINLIMSNTGTQDETITLTISRNGGTARRIWRGVLSSNWQARICSLPLNGTDRLLGASTTAGAVDYFVAIVGHNSPMTMAIYDDLGQLTSAPQILDSLAVLSS